MFDIGLMTCKFLMRIFPSYPNENDPHLWEVFKTNHYLSGSAEHQRAVRFSSSIACYEYENNDEISLLKNYFFPRISSDELEGKVLLDLGCFTGGRLTAWKEKYKLKSAFGIDINPVFKIAGDEFSESRNISDVEFTVGYGEILPYPDNSIDFIVSTDVLEHVRDVESVMNECFRILKNGGKLAVAFPQYSQPLESHLGLVTKTPALHWFFSGKIISRAYAEIVHERKNSDWYAPEFPMKSWEKLPSLNGITIQRFKNILSRQKWALIEAKIRPILTDGRRSKTLIFRLLSAALTPLAYIPYLNEFLLGRVNYVLTK